MKMLKYTTITFITIVMICTFVSMSASASIAPSDEDLHLKMHRQVAPSIAKIYDFDSYRCSMLPKNDQLRDEVLALSKIWPPDQPIPSGLIKAFTIAFAKLSTVSPDKLVVYEPIFVRLLADHKINYDDLWPVVTEKSQTIYADEDGDNLQVACSLQIELHRLVSEFKGENFMIGRGKKHGGFKQDDWFTMDLNRNCLPDTIGNARFIDHLKYFPNDRWQHIFFEHLDPTILCDLNTAKEYFRMSKDGGLLTFFSNRYLPREIPDKLNAQVKNQLRASLIAAGFTEILMRLHEAYKISKDATSKDGFVKSGLQYLYVSAVAKKS
jgi:hypothetical protein